MVYTLVPQRHDVGDCAIGCLATVLGETWERVFLEASRVHGYVLQNGLSTANILLVAKALGKPLRARTRRVYQDDLESLDGILEIIGDNHVVFLHQGSIIDLRDMTTCPFDEYFETRSGTRPGKLLTRQR